MVPKDCDCRRCEAWSQLTPMERCDEEIRAAEEQIAYWHDRLESQHRIKEKLEAAEQTR